MAYFNVKVSTRQSASLVTPLKDGYFKARLKASPVNNKANEELIRLLSSYFNVPRSLVTIVSGMHTREKLIRIDL